MGRTRRSELDVTERQRQVLDLLARGCTNGEIAESLGISLPGAKWHVHELMDRLGVDSRDEVADWWERERTWGGRLRGLSRGLLGAGLAKLAVAGAGAVILASAVAVVGLASNGRGSPSIDSEEASPSLSPDQAKARARAKLQAHLEMIGFDKQYTLGGHALGAADFSLETAQFYRAATHLPSLDPDKPPYLFAQPGIDVWRFTFTVTGVDEPATSGELNALVTVREDLPDVDSAYLWGDRPEVPGEGPQMLSEPELVAQIDDGDRHFEVTVWRSMNGWCQSIKWIDGPGLGGHCGGAARPFGPGQHLDAAGIHGDRGYVDAVVAIVSPRVALVRFTAVDGSVVEGIPAGDPSLPFAAVATRPSEDRGVTLIEALTADGVILATHGVQGGGPSAGPPPP